MFFYIISNIFTGVIIILESHFAFKLTKQLTFNCKLFNTLTLRVFRALLRYRYSLCIWHWAKGHRIEAEISLPNGQTRAAVILRSCWQIWRCIKKPSKSEMTGRRSLILSSHFSRELILTVPLEHLLSSWVKWLETTLHWRIYLWIRKWSLIIRIWRRPLNCSKCLKIIQCSRTRGNAVVICCVTYWDGFRAAIRCKAVPFVIIHASQSILHYPIQSGNLTFSHN